jgi:hypothetical protein
MRELHIYRRASHGQREIGAVCQVCASPAHRHRRPFPLALGKLLVLYAVAASLAGGATAIGDSVLVSAFGKGAVIQASGFRTHQPDEAARISLADDRTTPPNADPSAARLQLPDAAPVVTQPPISTSLPQPIPVLKAFANPSAAPVTTSGGFLGPMGIGFGAAALVSTGCLIAVRRKRSARSLPP